MPLNLSPDELLSTTRSVRKRLDFDRPVEPEIIRECLELALQAPSGGNRQGWHFIVVTDPEKRLALGQLYKQAWDIYRKWSLPNPDAPKDADAPQDADTPPEPESPDLAAAKRMVSSAAYLAEHLHEVPVLLIACVEGRVENATPMPTFQQASTFGSILPAVWSFMLAARARGLGTCWTTLHLMFEEQAAQVLGIPYESITQAALIPVAYTKGEEFKPGGRKSLDGVLHLEGW